MPTVSVLGRETESSEPVSNDGTSVLDSVRVGDRDIIDAWKAVPCCISSMISASSLHLSILQLVVLN